MSDIVMQLLDITSEDVVVVADLVEVRASVVDLDVALFDSPLYLLNLIIDLNTLFLALMNALVDVVLVALEMRDDLGLVSEALLIFLARLLDLVLQASYLSLQVGHHVLQDLVIAISCLVILDLISVSCNYSISRIICMSSLSEAGLM